MIFLGSFSCHWNFKCLLDRWPTQAYWFFLSQNKVYRDICKAQTNCLLLPLFCTSQGLGVEYFPCMIWNFSTFPKMDLTILTQTLETFFCREQSTASMMMRWKLVNLFPEGSLSVHFFLRRDVELANKSNPRRHKQIKRPLHTARAAGSRVALLKRCHRLLSTKMTKQCPDWLLICVTICWYRTGMIWVKENGNQFLHDPS